MAQEGLTKELFNKIRPICNDIAQKPTPKAIFCLTDEIEKFETLHYGIEDALAPLVDYISIPLLLVLKKNLGWAEEEAALKCLAFIIKRSKYVSSAQLFTPLFSSSFTGLANPKTPSEPSDSSEEYQQLVLDLVVTLMRHCSPSLLLQMYSDQRHQGMLAHAVLLTLNIATTSHNKEIRVTAFQLVRELGLESTLQKAPSDDLLQLARNIFKGFLPGICTKTTKVGCGNHNQGHRVTEEALSTFSYFLNLLMADEHIEAQLGSKSSTLDSLMEQMNMEEETVKHQQNDGAAISEEWLTATSVKVCQMLELLCQHNVCHPHASTRRVLAEVLLKVLNNCRRSLSGSSVVCLETLACLSSSDVSLQDSLGKIEITEAKEQLQARLSGAFRRLPAVARSHSDDTRLLSLLQQISGSLHLLGTQYNSFFFSMPSQLNRVFTNVAEVMAYETTDDILKVTNHLVTEQSSYPSTVLSFRHLSPSSLSVCQDILTSVAVSTTLASIMDSWIECYECNKHLRHQLIQMMAGVVSGSSSQAQSKGINVHKEQEVEEFVTNICDTILSREAILSPIDLAENESSSSSQSDAIPKKRTGVLSSLDSIYNRLGGSNGFNPYSQSIGFNSSNQDVPSVLNRKNSILTVVCSLHLLAACSQLMGHNYLMFLGITLCPLLQHCGSPLIIVSNTARKALQTVALSCGYKGAKELISEGANHYWFPLSLQIKSPVEHPFATQALQVALEYNTSTGTLSPLMQQLLEELLLTLDSYHSVAPQQLLNLLRLFLACKKGEPSSNCEVENEPDVKLEPSSEESTALGPVTKALLSHYENQKEMKQAFEKETKFVNDGMNEILTDAVLEDIAEEKQKIDENIKKLEEEIADRKKREKSNLQGEGDEIIPEENEVPHELQMIVDVMERCCFLLHTKDRSISLVLLDTLELGCEALTVRENTQLPILHKIWKPMLLRIKDKDSIVMLRSMVLLCSMVARSGDFLRRRCIKDLLPVVREFLSNQSICSKSRTSRAAYLLTYQYYVQCKLLKDIFPKLIPSLKLSSVEMVHTYSCIVQYLDNEQPEELVKSALELLQFLAQTQPQMAWFFAAHLRQPFQMEAPGHKFEPVKIKGRYSQIRNIPSGVEKLFHDLS